MQTIIDEAEESLDNARYALDNVCGSVESRTVGALESIAISNMAIVALLIELARKTKGE